MGKITGIFEGPDGRLSFSRIWGAALGTLVLGVYVYATLTQKPMPPETMYLLAIGMAPYVTKEGGNVVVKVLELFQKR